MEFENLILEGDALTVLRRLPDRCVQTCVTSPPYFRLRNYNVEGQIGLEGTPGQFIYRLLEVFQEVHRVLKDNGTLWVNIGDTYGKVRFSLLHCEMSLMVKKPKNRGNKELMGIPWKLAFALQEQGWLLRQEIIWNKSNCLPESVRDRCTKSHETLFLFTKQAKYFFNQMLEPAVGINAHDLTGSGHHAPGQNPQTGNRDTWRGSSFHTGKTGEHQLDRSSKNRNKGNRKTFRGGGVYTDGQSFDNSSDAQNDSIGNTPRLDGLRNRRSVWTIATHPFKEAHFATFPPKLVEPCILSGSAPGDLVLDPFSGAGTTALVASQHGRKYVGIELNPEYATMSRGRLDKSRASVSAPALRLCP